jgi:hypothetical protein
MPTVQVPAHLTIEHLMTTVEQLSPPELREFKQRLAAWEDRNGPREETEADLIQATQVQLPARDERRLRRLISQSERGMLTLEEAEKYRALAQQAERLNVARVEALAKLVQRRGQPTREALCLGRRVLADHRAHFHGSSDRGSTPPEPPGADQSAPCSPRHPSTSA